MFWRQPTPPLSLRLCPRCAITHEILPPSIGMKPNSGFQKRPKRAVQQAFPLVSSGLTFRVKSSATSGYASWGLWTKQESTWLPMRFWTKHLRAVAAQNTLRVPVWGILLGSYRN